MQNSFRPPADWHGEPVVLRVAGRADHGGRPHDGRRTANHHRPHHPQRRRQDQRRPHGGAILRTLGMNEQNQMLLQSPKFCFRPLPTSTIGFIPPTRWTTSWSMTEKLLMTTG